MRLNTTEYYLDEEDAFESVNKFLRAWPPQGYGSRTSIHKEVKGSDIVWRVDYSRWSSSDYDNAPTHPHHGGKLMPHQMPLRIEELEADLRDYQQQVSKLEDELDEAEDAYQAESDLGDALADQIQSLLTERDRLALEVERLQQANAILRAERSGAVWVCPECDIAGCQHYRAALNPEGEVDLRDYKDRLEQLVRRAQDLIDPCYPDTCKAWQDDARAALNPYMRHTRAAAKRALDTGRNSDG